MLIDGQIYFNMTIGEYTNFLRYEDLIALSILEHSGAGCVEVNVSFRTTNRNIKNLIVANNKIKIDIGQSEKDCTTYEVYPYEINPTTDSSDQQFSVSFTATPCLAFLLEMSTESFSGTSADVINEISKRYFNKEAHIFAVPYEDKHTWIRGFNSGAQYLIDTCLHMNLLDNGCPVMYIDKDCEVHVNDLNVIKSGKPSFKFVPRAPQSGEMNTYQYLNHFEINYYKDFTNNFTGFGDVTAVTNTLTGEEDILIPENEPDLASTSIVEKSVIQNTRYTESLYQSDNMHENYHKAYKRNVARLINLAGIESNITIYGFHPEIKPTQLVEVDAGNIVDSGSYLVDSKLFTIGYNTPATTTIAVCRDNRNRVEDADQTKRKSLLSALKKLLGTEISKTLKTIRNLRRCVVMGRQLLNGHFTNQVFKFLNGFKYNMLTSFSLFGVRLDFNNSLALMNTLKSAGNALCNQLIDSFLPYPYNYVFRNYAIERPSLKTLLSKVLNQFAPQGELRALISEISGLLGDLTGTASKVYAESYKIYSMKEYAESGYSTGTLTGIDGKEITLPNSKGEDMSLIGDQNKIQGITTEFINNTSGADIPIPNITLTEAESLLNEDDLKNLLADKTVASLTEKGYLLDIDNFKDILLGLKPLDFNTINKINKNIGEMLYARFWGTFTDIRELSEFNIRNSFKDIYVTVPATKIINALKGARVFMALPASENSLTFFLNNKEVEMDLMKDVDLGYKTISGYPLYYNVYMSRETFNSNSVILEVRKRAE